MSNDELPVSRNGKLAAILNGDSHGDSHTVRSAKAESLGCSAEARVVEDKIDVCEHGARSDQNDARLRQVLGSRVVGLNVQSSRRDHVSSGRYIFKRIFAVDIRFRN